MKVEQHNKLTQWLGYSLGRWFEFSELRYDSVQGEIKIFQIPPKKFKNIDNKNELELSKGLEAERKKERKRNDRKG